MESRDRRWLFLPQRPRTDRSALVLLQQPFASQEYDVSITEICGSSQAFYSLSAALQAEMQYMLSQSEAFFQLPREQKAKYSFDLVLHKILIRTIPLSTMLYCVHA